MRVVFMGTPDFAVPSLEALDAAFEVALVVTRPDAVRGRGRRLEPSPVKAKALELGLSVAEARRVDDALLDRVRALAPDVIAVAAYGAILPDALIAIPRLECVNVHGSLLPRWRGAAPIQRGILAGDEFAGVSIMRVVHDLDAGAYCRQARVAIGSKPCGQVMAEVAQVGASELVAAIRDIEAGRASWVDQDESLVTYAHKVEKAEMQLDPASAARDNALRVQASTDAAPARCLVGGHGVRVLEAGLSEGEAPDPGQASVGHGEVTLGCADGGLRLMRVKPDGKREMEAGAWAQGLRAASLPWGRVGA